MATSRIQGGKMKDMWVTPWWDLNHPIKVCAFDAQLTEVSASGVDCSTADGRTDPECGCGENLKWCSSTTVQKTMQAALSDALSERVRIVLQDDRTYSDIITSSTVMMNGPMVDWYINRACLFDHTDKPS